MDLLHTNIHNIPAVFHIFHQVLQGQFVSAQAPARLYDHAGLAEALS